MYQRFDNKRNKNWFIFVIFFFSIIVFFVSLIDMFFIFKQRTQLQSWVFWSLIIANAIIFIYSIVGISWSMYKIFKESEQICFPYPTLTPFILGYPQSKQSPSEKLFNTKVTSVSTQM